MEIFCHSLANDILHLDLKQQAVDVAGNNAVSGLTVVGTCSMRVATCPIELSNVTVTLRRETSSLFENVGSFHCILAQVPVETSDSEEFENGSAVSVEHPTSPMQSPLLRRGSSDISHNNRIGKSNGSFDKAQGTANNKSWKDKAISIFKGKNQTQPAQSIAADEEGSSAAMECNEYHYVGTEISRMALHDAPTNDLPHPLALLSGNTHEGVSREELPKYEITKRPTVEVAGISEMFASTSAKNALFETVKPDMSDLLGAFADDLNFKNRALSSDKVHLMNSQDPIGSIPRSLPDENQVDDLPKRRSILKPAKRCSLSLALDRINVVEGDDIAPADCLSVVNERQGDVANDMCDTTTSDSAIECVRDSANDLKADKCDGQSEITKRRYLNEYKHSQEVRLAVCSGEIVGIFSEVTCSECGFLHFEEECAGQWASSPHSLQALSKTNSLVQSFGSSVLRSVHKIRCVHCSASIAPTLTVKCYAESAVECGNPIELFEKWSKSVIFLSTFCLRLVCEHLLALHGQQALDPTFLERDHSDVFWCLRWYSTRLACPVGFIQSDCRDLGLLVCGRRESIVKARIHNMFLNVSLKGHVGKNYDLNITRNILELCFPGVSSDCIDLMANTALNDLDGSVTGMRRAILSIYPNIDRIFSRGAKVNLYVAKARNLYTCILVLCHTTRAGEKLLKCTGIMPLGMQKVMT